MSVPTFGVTAAMLEEEIAGLDLTNFVPTPAGAARAITRAGARVAGLFGSLGEDAETIDAAITGVLYQRCQDATIYVALAYLFDAREGGTSEQGRRMRETAERLITELREFPGSLGSERSTAYTSAGTVIDWVGRATAWDTQRAARTSVPLRDMLIRGVR